MSISRWRWMLAGVLLAACQAPVVALEEFPAPPDAKVQAVAGDTQAMGMNLQIRKFTVDLPVDKVLAFYRQRWKEDAVEQQMPPWSMIGRAKRGRYYNVQVQSAGGQNSWGYLSVSNLPELLKKKKYSLDNAGKGFPKMSGSRVLDDQFSYDAGRKARTLMIENDFSVAGNANFYRRHYAGQGWDTVMDEVTAARGQGQALYFSRGGDTVTITINRINNKTSVVANHETRSLLDW